MTLRPYTNTQPSGTVSLTLFRAEKARAVEAEQQAAFEAYVAAKQKADLTLDLADGIAAGKRWRALVELFVGRG